MRKTTTKKKPVTNTEPTRIPPVVDLLRQYVTNSDYSTRPNQELAAQVSELIRLEKEKDDLEIKLASVKDELDALKKTDIPSLMLQMGVLDENNNGKITLADGTLVHTRKRNFANVPKEHQTDFIEWLRAQGLAEGLVKENIHYHTLNSFVSSMIDEGIPLPEYVTVISETLAVVRVKKG